MAGVYIYFYVMFGLIMIGRTRSQSMSTSVQLPRISASIPTLLIIIVQPFPSSANIANSTFGNSTNGVMANISKAGNFLWLFMLCA